MKAADITSFALTTGIRALLHAMNYISGHRFTNCEWDYILTLPWRKKQKMYVTKIQSRYFLSKKADPLHAKYNSHELPTYAEREEDSI
jgi:hypothetical protein